MVMDTYISYEVLNGYVKLVGGPQHIQQFPIPQRMLKLTINNGVLILPSSVENLPIAEIEDFIFMPSGKEDFPDSIVETLVIPDTYQRLGKKNFSQWKNLKILHLICRSNSLCDFNFAYCDRLTTVFCGNEEIFHKCKSITRYDEHCYGCFDSIYDKIDFIHGN